MSTFNNIVLEKISCDDGLLSDFKTFQFRLGTQTQYFMAKYHYDNY